MRSQGCTGEEKQPDRRQKAAVITKRLEVTTVRQIKFRNDTRRKDRKQTADGGVLRWPHR